MFRKPLFDALKGIVDALHDFSVKGNPHHAGDGRFASKPSGGGGGGYEGGGGGVAGVRTTRLSNGDVMHTFDPKATPAARRAAYTKLSKSVDARYVKERVEADAGVKIAKKKVKEAEARLASKIAENPKVNALTALLKTKMEAATKRRKEYAKFEEESAQRIKVLKAKLAALGPRKRRKKSEGEEGLVKIEKALLTNLNKIEKCVLVMKKIVIEYREIGKKASQL